MIVFLMAIIDVSIVYWKKKLQKLNVEAIEAFFTIIITNEIRH